MVGRPWAPHAGAILAGLTSGATFLFGAAYYAGFLGSPAAGASPQPIGAGLMVTAAIAAVVTSNPMRTRLAGVLGFDPDQPVHTLALALAVILIGMQVSLLAFVDVLAADRSQPPLTVVDLFAQEAPFLILAATGVGLYIRRNATQTLVRLGVVRPAWWQITLALTAAGAFFAISQAGIAVSHAVTPDVAHSIDATEQQLFGGLNNPVGIAAIALLPAICEEILFRGALQPRLGLLATALLFTLIHTQYGVSFDTLVVFVLAVGLGLIRKYTNTTTSGLCHATYNLLVSIGLGGQLLGLAAVAELALAAVTAYALWSLRRRRIGATNSPGSIGS